MKIANVFLLILFFFQTCAQQPSVQSSWSKISYEASSRGFFKSIWVSQDTLFVKTAREGLVQQRKITANEKQELQKMIERLKENTTATGYEEDIARDAEIPATLLVVKNGEEKRYEFGHSNPPKGLVALIDKLFVLEKTFD